MCYETYEILSPRLNYKLTWVAFFPANSDLYSNFNFLIAKNNGGHNQRWKLHKQTISGSE